ncbi:TlpA disulfide reductase family protein [Bacteroides oleiciplenus]|uniref:TlpA disulfide reductase family protein n=1 Tax=Bacteroides oleiciplenus TaxID=626931 RepID=UPI0026DDA2F1|nr:TlpA disulfide reductase family protein [Bacteroides oleiciplenus]
MNRLILGTIFVLTIVCPSLLYGTDTFKLHGRLETANDGDTIMLFTFRGDKILSVDTTTIKNKTFFFTGKEYVEDFSVLTSGNFPKQKVWATELILESGDIQVELRKRSKVTGTRLNDVYNSYIERAWEADEVGNKLLALPNYPNDSINKLLQENSYQQRLFITKLTKENISNIVGKRIFVWDNAIFRNEDFQELCSMLDEESKQDFDIIDAIAERKKNEEKNALREKLFNTEIGDFELVDADGNIRHISEIASKSKYLFIDCWASWCGPCVAGFPDLKEVYAKYKDKGLEILGISFDRNKAAWKMAMKRHDLPWTNWLSTDEGGKMMKNLQIQGIPYGILIDSGGRILELGIMGAAHLDIMLNAFFIK